MSRNVEICERNFITRTKVDKKITEINNIKLLKRLNLYILKKSFNILNQYNNEKIIYFLLKYLEGVKLFEVITATKESREYVELYLKVSRLNLNFIDEKFKKSIEDEEFKHRKERKNDIITILDNIINTDFFYRRMIDEGYFFILCDEEGYVIKLIYNDKLENYFKEINFAEGVSLKLENGGINAVSLAMEYKQQYQICGNEHQWDILKNWYCTAIPIIDYTNALIIAYLDLSCVNCLNIDYQSFILRNIVKCIEKALTYKNKLYTIESELTLIDTAIIYWLAHGMERKDICKVMHIAENTLKNHIKKLRLLLKANTDAELVFKAAKIGIIDLY
jgi:DNA-binding CsgD family transcriptional regulator